MADSWDETKVTVRTDIGTVTFVSMGNIMDPNYDCNVSKTQSSGYYSTVLPDDYQDMTPMFGYKDGNNWMLYPDEVADSNANVMPYYADNSTDYFSVIDIDHSVGWPGMPYSTDVIALKLKGVTLFARMCCTAFSWIKDRTYCAGVRFTHYVNGVGTVTYYRLLTFKVSWSGSELTQTSKRVTVSILDGHAGTASTEWTVCGAYVGPYPYNRSIGTVSEICGTFTGYECNTIEFMVNDKTVRENISNSTDVILASSFGFNLTDTPITATVIWTPAAPNLYCKQGNSWKKACAMYVKVNGSWKKVNSIKINKDGTWKNAK